MHTFYSKLIVHHILFRAPGDLSGSRGSQKQELGKWSDDELVKRCKSELPYQTLAFEVLVNRYRNKVFGKVASMMKNQDDAYDVVQDVFVRVFNGLPKFKGDSSFSTWLYTITVNTSLNYIDKMKRRPLWWVSEDVNEVKLNQQEDASLFSVVEQGLERKDLRRLIDKALELVTPAHKEILLLRYFQEMDYQTISDTLDISLSATKMRLKRAREEFKERFEPLMEE